MIADTIKPKKKSGGIQTMYDLPSYYGGIARAIYGSSSMDFRSITRKFCNRFVESAGTGYEGMDDGGVEWLVERISNWTRIRG